MRRKCMVIFDGQRLVESSSSPWLSGAQTRQTGSLSCVVRPLWRDSPPNEAVEKPTGERSAHRAAPAAVAAR